jgi:hypothetical protein
VHRADHREPVLRLVVSDRVATRKDRTGRAHPLVRTGENFPEHLYRQLLGKSGNREREQRHAAHREDVVQGIRRRNGSERARIVDQRREEVDREDDRALVVETVDRRVVRRVETDEQILRVGGNEAREQTLEADGRVLGRAAAGTRERRERHRLHD